MAVIEEYEFTGIYYGTLASLYYKIWIVNELFTQEQKNLANI